MADLQQTLELLRQARWREAQRATGGSKDDATDALIRAHQAILAVEAAIADGAPEAVWTVDVEGRPLDPEHPWNKQKG